MELGNIKIFGGVGSLLILIGFAPYIGFLFTLGGIILILIANYKLSKITNNQDIFRNSINGFTIEFIGSIVGGVLLGNSIELMMTGQQVSFGIFSIIGLIFIYASIIFGNYYLKKSFELIGNYFNQNLFNLGGNFLFWGAVGLIAFGLGLIALFIGWILITLAYFNLSEKNSFA